MFFFKIIVFTKCFLFWYLLVVLGNAYHEEIVGNVFFLTNLIVLIFFTHKHISLFTYTKNIKCLVFIVKDIWVFKIIAVQTLLFAPNSTSTLQMTPSCPLLNTDSKYMQVQFNLRLWIMNIQKEYISVCLKNFFNTKCL